MQLMRLAGWVLVAMFGGAVALIGQHFIFPVPKVVTGEVASAEAVVPNVPAQDASVVPGAPLLDPSAARIITLETLAASGIRSQVIRQGRHPLRGQGRKRSETMPLVSFACSATYSCLTLMNNIKRRLEPAGYQLVRSNVVDRPYRPIYRAIAKGANPVLALRAYPPDPRLTVVIADVGKEPALLDSMLALDQDVTYAVSVNEPYAGEVATKLTQAGREFIAHLPLEPSVSDDMDGPAFLTRAMTLDEVKTQVRTFLNRVPGAVGADGHLGGGFTQSPRHVGALLEVLAETGLYFLDQRTSESASIQQQARALGIRSAARTHRIEAAGTAVEAKLRAVEVALVLEGQALVIAEASPTVIGALKDWLKNLRKREIHLIRLSETVL
ncbi:MAG: divergent polysaccharide deacetylase family protein [Bradymonadia bacterium]